MQQYESSITLLREIARLAGVTQVERSEVLILKQIVRALGGVTYPSDKEFHLWKRIAQILGVTVGVGDNKWRIMYLVARAGGSGPPPPPPPPGFNAETQAIIDRVTADGGELEVNDAMNTFIGALVDGGVYNTSIIEALYIPGFAWKDGGSRAVSKFYDLMPAKSAVFWDQEPFVPASPQVISEAGAGVDGVSVISFNSGLSGYRCTGIPTIAAGVTYETFYVCRWDSVAAQGLPFGRGDASTRDCFVVNNAGDAANINMFRGTAASRSSTLTTLGIYFNFFSSGVNSLIRRNNSQLGDLFNCGDRALGDASSILSIGSRFDNSIKFNGPVAGFVSIAGGVTLTTDQRNTIFNALAALFPSAT